MKQPDFWLRALLVVCIPLIILQYLALTWIAPRYIIHVLERAVGGHVAVGRLRLSLPFTTTLAALRLSGNSETSAFSAQRVVIKGRWVSLPSRTIWLDAVELDRPILRVTRTRDGRILWPSLPPGDAPDDTARDADRSWRIHADAVKISDGVIEFIDQRPSSPFHGALDHVYLVMGPATMTFHGARASLIPSANGWEALSLAIRAQLVGHWGHAAPLYCSGWMDAAAKDLQASCRMDTLPLAALEPYYSGPAQLRVYAATLKTTSQWSARANDFSGRVQLELDNLTEGDLSVRGRTILDVKKLISTGAPPRLSAEIRLNGLLDAPAGWRAELLTGDQAGRQLIERLLERDVKMLSIPAFGHRMRISLLPAGHVTAEDIEAASREVQEALEILAMPAKPAVPLAAEPPKEATVPAVDEAATPQAPPAVPVSPAPSLPQPPDVPGEPQIEVPIPPSRPEPQTPPAQQVPPESLEPSAASAPPPTATQEAPAASMGR